MLEDKVPTPAEILDQIDTLYYKKAEILSAATNIDDKDFTAAMQLLKKILATAQSAHANNDLEELKKCQVRMNQFSVTLFQRQSH